jgi:hypothetical protein
MFQNLRGLLLLRGTFCRHKAPSVPCHCAASLFQTVAVPGSGRQPCFLRSLSRRYSTKTSNDSVHGEWSPRAVLFLDHPSLLVRTVALASHYFVMNMMRSTFRRVYSSFWRGQFHTNSRHQSVTVAYGASNSLML